MASGGGKTEVQEKMANAMAQAREAASNVGAAVSDFFQSSPFETDVGRKIELATDAEHLNEPNVGLNMEICDYINYTNDGGRNAMRAIRKRLVTAIERRQTRTVMYTLTVLDSSVKNCDERFKQLVCDKDFINELVRLISAKYDAGQAVQERVLGLIQSWSDAFRGNPALVGVSEVYDELKSKGVEFPPVDLDTMTPIITPKRTAAVSSSRQPTSTMAEDPLAKLRADVDTVNINITVLRDLLTELRPDDQLPEEWTLIQELHATLREMQQRIQALISAEFSDDVTYELLTTNNEINNINEKFERFASHLNETTSQQPQASTPRLEAEQPPEQLIALSVDDKPTTNSAAASRPNYTVDDAQQLSSLRTVAFDKPMLTDEQAQDLADWLGDSAPCKHDRKDIHQQHVAASSTSHPKKPDDGL